MAATQASSQTGTRTQGTRKEGRHALCRKADRQSESIFFPLVRHKIEIILTIFFLGQRKAWHSSVSFLLVAIRANTWSYVASAEQYEILKQIYLGGIGGESRTVSYLYLSDFLGGKKVLITKYSPPPRP